MSFLAKLALLFILVPIVELALLVKLGQVVGFWPTLLLVILTGVGGAVLARAEGTRTLWKFRSELEAGRLPGQALLDGLSVLVGGAFLLTPGLLTDLAGFALLAPPTRHLIQRGVRRRLERAAREGSVSFMVVSDRPGRPGPEDRPSPRPREDGDYDYIDLTDDSSRHD